MRCQPKQLGAQRNEYNRSRLMVPPQSIHEGTANNLY